MPTLQIPVHKNTVEARLKRLNFAVEAVETKKLVAGRLKLTAPPLK